MVKAKRIIFDNIKWIVSTKPSDGYKANNLSFTTQLVQCYLDNNYPKAETILDVFDDDSYETICDLAKQKINQKVIESIDNDKIKDAINHVEITFDFSDIKMINYVFPKINKIVTNKIVYSTVKQQPKYDYE